MELNSTPTQILSSAFVFGGVALVFATMPFIYILINGMMKARNGNTPSSSIISVFCSAFIVHTISCVFFILGIKLLDVLNAIYEEKYFQGKLFEVFWARGKDAIFNLVNASGTTEEEGAYLQLFMIQTITDWFILLMPIIVLFTACSYGTIQAKKDSAHSDYISFFIWLGISNIIAFFVFFIWAKIASLALFIPNGQDLISKTFEYYQNLNF
ncbi:hypothetical protein EOD82_09015 [Campylobacter jejuni]|nr:hypothetical protein [Campylobacter jejuni]ECK2550111.1 hypothetical protein [Campylobacter jejuni]